MTQTVLFQAGNFVRYLRNLASHIDGSRTTEQIFIIVDNNLWWRLYWNPSNSKRENKNWEVSQHTIEGWGDTSKFTTEELLPLISDHQEVLLKARGFEHKTVSQITVYKSENMKSKSSQPELIY